MKYTSRTQARGQECPACGAHTDERCIGARGQVRESVHRERMQLASAKTGTIAVSTLSLQGDKLVDVSGTVQGKVVGLEIDVQGSEGGTYGGGGEGSGVDVDSQTERSTQLPGVKGGSEQTSMLEDPVTEVWAHYQQVIPNGNRRKLDARRKTCIRKALTVRSVDECKQAITALSRSDFHQGKNDRQTAYNDIEYALGKRTDSPDAVIDRWLERGGSLSERTPVQAKIAAVPDDAKHIVTDRMQKVRRMFTSPNHEPSVRAGQEAAEQLRKYPGIEAVADEHNKFTGWVVVE